MAKECIRYDTRWTDYSDIEIERDMVRAGGYKQRPNSQNKIGHGLFFHFKRFQELLWPEKLWHKWNRLQLEKYLTNRIIAVLGPASSGKSHSAATDILADYYCWPECTTVLVSSTEREMLEMRIFGEMKKLHRLAKERWPDCPGYLLESRQRIVSDDKNEQDGRDFRNGVVGVPAKKGETWVGLSAFVGVKNKRVRMVADECSLMMPAFIEAIANLNKNPDFKCVALGNPKSTTDALGRLAEPSDESGGWDSGIDQSGPTKSWPTRFNEGVCIQLVGSDSPNLDGSLGIDLITQKQIDADVKFYGRDSLQFTMMNEGRMPRGEGSRRVITRQMVVKFQAMEPVVWKGDSIVKLASLDAAYGAVGGDRCMFCEAQFSMDIRGKQVFALIETMLVPVSVKNTESPEDQITAFCKLQCEHRGIPPEHFFYDAGMRTSLVMAFSRIWSPNVVSIDSMGPATERPVDDSLVVIEDGRKRPKRCDEHYSKLVSELWFSVRYAIEANQFRGMTESVMEEGSKREWGMVSGNRIEVEPKKKMKEREGRSPDEFDTVAYAVEGARRLGFRIDRLANPHATVRDDRWKDDLRYRQKRLQNSYTLEYAA